MWDGLCTKSRNDGLFELGLKGAEGIARVFFCTLVGRRMIMLHSFIKKTPKTPKREIKVAQTRMKEVKLANPCTTGCQADASPWRSQRS